MRYHPTTTTYFAMILPGIAMLNVCDLPFPVASNRAVGLEVSSSSLGA